jgi:tetratricopeptide (TPR) repeat protein
LEPFFLGYLLIPLGYTSALAALSASAERALERGYPERAVRLLTWARRAPFLRTYRSMCEVNLITAAFALENYRLVDEVWRDLQPRLESLRPYAGSALASYGATLIGRGRYHEAEAVLTHPVQSPKPNHPVDDIAVLCCAFCRANLTSAYINMGRFEEASLQLDTLSDEAGVHPVLASLTSYLRAVLAYPQGHPEEGRALVGALDITRLPLLYQTELYYHFAIILARCGDVENAGRCVSRVQWETSSHRKLTRLRSLAQAEIACAEGQDQRAVSYFRDLLALSHVDALAYLRASAICKKLGQEEQARNFLQGATRLDPESHWAAVARGRLDRETTPP